MNPRAVMVLADGTPYGLCRTRSCRKPLGAFEHDRCDACEDRMQAAVDAFCARRDAELATAEAAS